MNIQSIFYIVAIIALVLWIVILFVLAAVLIKLYKSIRRVENNIQSVRDNISGKVSGLIKANKLQLAGSIGLAIASLIKSRLKEGFRRKKQF